MFQVDYDLSKGGWASKPAIVPYGPLKIQTSATSLHYGLTAYEGFSVLQNAKTGQPQAFKA